MVKPYEHVKEFSCGSLGTTTPTHAYIDIIQFCSLVFLGVAHANLDEDEDAEESYKRAIEINDTQMLAWQGLLSFYEKRGRYKDVVNTINHLLPRVVKSGEGNRLADYLNKLLDIYGSKEKDEEKYIEIMKYFLPGSKYYDLVKTASDIPHPLDIWKTLVAKTEDEEAKLIESRIHSRRFMVSAGPLSQVTAEVEAQVYGNSKLGEMYETMLSLNPNNMEELQIKLLNFWRKKLAGVPDKAELYEKIAKMAKTLVNLKAKDPLPYELIIEMSDVENADQYDEDILTYLCENYPETGLAKLAQGYSLYKQQKTDEAFDFFGDGLDLSPRSLYGYQCLSQIYYESKEFDNGLEYATRGRELVNELAKETGKILKNVLLSMELFMAHCYRQLDAKYYPDAMKLYKKILDTYPDQLSALEGSGLILCSDKKYDEALVCFEKVYASDPTRHIALAEIGWIYCEKEAYERAIEYISSAIEKSGDVTEYYYRLGRVYWAMGGEYQQDPGYAFKYFLQAAKIDPQFAGGFAYLGHYYRIVKHDHTRAKKCYQKAYLINPLDVDIAFQLSEYYISDKEGSKAEEIFRQITELVPKTSWAWRRLGYATMNVDNYSEAITCFQKALRTDTSDVRCWEGLAEAYAHEGRYVAALRAFERATDLDPLSIHANHQKALVKQKVGMLEEAISGFLETLALAEKKYQSSYMPSILGLADTYLDRAREDFQQGFFGRTATECGLVIQTALTGLQQDPSVMCLWKLIGDACVMYRLVPSYLSLCAYEPLQQAMLLLEESPHKKLGLPEDESSKLVDDFTQLDVSPEEGEFYLPPKTVLDVVYSCAGVSYKQAIVLCRNHPAIAPAYWHDTALVYHWMAENNLAEATHDGLSDMAIKCIRMALKIEPAQYLYWNALGVISMRRYPKLSQHALIKAMEYSNRSAAPWTNYGFLCLSLEDYELANQAFETAHSLDPEWISAWVGQAYVASLWGTDAAAIFEHAFESSNGSALEASYGYADTVFTQLSVTGNAPDGASLLSPAFALQKLTEQKLNDALALNLLGLLLERLGQFERAAEAFAGAILALETQAEQGRIGEIELKKRMTKVHGNLGRTLCASGDFSGAIASYNSALAMGGTEGSARTYCQLGAGIAYYFEDQLEESLGMFETALNETESDPLLRQDVVVLLSKVLWALGGDEQREVAKEQLFSSIADNPNYLPAIFSLCVMGMLEDDSTLTGAALQELAKVSVSDAFESDKEQWIPWLFSRFYKLQGSQAQASRSIAKSVHQLPWLALLWRNLASDLVNSSSDSRGNVLQTMTSSALAITLGEKNPSAEDKAIAYECVARASKGQKAIRESQRAIMAAPWRLSSWQILATSIQ
ncbi:hypothetical protein J3Q64DRAFT_1872086 [Phycomyces blakesleeanus]|uniref:Superkiller protein 3 n=1 Tax=Phycomyces blakesleeanus TaxID=4837 RepID=A0ABR3AQ93_PHYBL